VGGLSSEAIVCLTLRLLAKTGELDGKGLRLTGDTVFADFGCGFVKDKKDEMLMLVGRIGLVVTGAVANLEEREDPLGGKGEEDWSIFSIRSAQHRLDPWISLFAKRRPATER
jgi:hypothetical protein